MKHYKILLVLVIATSIYAVGCVDKTPRRPLGHKSKLGLGRDVVLTKSDSLLVASRAITQVEDHLRRDGTITIKSPDVWTDSNLMHSIQEFDSEMKTTLSNFSETVQAYIASSDGTGSLFEAAVSEPDTATVDNDSLGNLEISRATKDLFAALAASKKQATPTGEFRLEPTELERQHATYVDLNQALRRRKMGGDNNRRPGYGLYMFRIPVSVLPGEETSQGFSAKVDFQANMIITKADVKYSIPRMAIAELVERTAKRVHDKWTDDTIIGSENAPVLLGAQIGQVGNLSPNVSKRVRNSNENHGELHPIRYVQEDKEEIYPGQEGTYQIASLPNLDGSDEKYTPLDILLIRDYLLEVNGSILKKSKAPSLHELRNLMFSAFVQISIHLQELDAFDYVVPTGNGDRIAIIQAGKEIELGLSTKNTGKSWMNMIENTGYGYSAPYKNTAWMVARQCGLVDLNIKRMINEMTLRGEFSDEFLARAYTVNFLSNHDLDEAVFFWRTLIEKEFPLQVFTLDPLVEEQNLLDSQSSIREMQMALALSVANGGWNVGQRVQLARELALDTAAIGVNRTAVGFVHGMNSFGWYFHPRIQSPDYRSQKWNVLGSRFQPFNRTESKALYRLEPGIRECEVLIAMPSFITQVSFDVATNWERLSNPGRSKRSYEELVAEGCRVQDLREYINSVGCFRECQDGDVQRLIRKVEQLEKMVGLQTHVVNVPFDYGHPAGELFDEGERSLQPVVHGFYGLQQLVAKQNEKDEFTADFFVTGRNFHPTLTRVIVGGHESHSLVASRDGSGVEILSRELIRVRTKINTDKFSGDKFLVRIGTPNGISGPLEIPKSPQPKVVQSDFDWSETPEFKLFVIENSDPSVAPTLGHQQFLAPKFYKLKMGSRNPLNELDFSKLQPALQLNYTIEFEDGKELSHKGESHQLLSPGIDQLALVQNIVRDLQTKIPLPERRRAKITATGYLKIHQWPLTKLGSPIEITLEPQVLK